MTRTVYLLVMSVFAGAVIGGVVANFINIVDPDIPADYELSTAVFTAIIWALLSLLDFIFRRPEAPHSVQRP